MLRIPDEIKQVSLIFMFLNRPDLAPIQIPANDVLPVHLDQPKGWRSRERSRKNFKERTGLAALSDMLRDQDFSLVLLNHGSAVRPNGDKEYACKFVFKRHVETSHIYEAQRLADLDGLVQHTVWVVQAEAYDGLAPSLKITCSSPRDIRTTQPALRAG